MKYGTSRRIIETNSFVLICGLLLSVLLSGSAQSVPWPIAGIPHDDSSIAGNYYDFRDRPKYVPIWIDWIGMFHHAVDIIAPDVGTSVIAVAPGKVSKLATDLFPVFEIKKNKWTGLIVPDDRPYFHRIDVCDPSDTSMIWAYLHVTKHYKNRDPQERWLIGAGVQTGDHLGVVSMPIDPFSGQEDPDLAHVHLSRRKYISVIPREAYAAGVQNPLELLDEYADSHPPIIPGAHGIQELAFRNNAQVDSLKKYFSKKFKPFPSWPWDRYYEIYDKVDILANINDWTAKSWKGVAGPHMVAYQIFREKNDGSLIACSAIETTFVADGQGVTTEAPTNDLVRVIYEKDEFNSPVGSFGRAGEERFIYIVTNTDGDGMIELEDTLRCWKTTSITAGNVDFPDGNYRVCITAGDISNNTIEYWSESKWLSVNNYGAADIKLQVKEKTVGGGATRETIVYDAEWIDGELNVTVNEQAQPTANDSILVDLFFTESMYPDSIFVRLEGTAPLQSVPVSQLRWETEEYENDHWVGYIPYENWDSVRNIMEGERRFRILAWDLAGSMLDTDPSTYAHIDTLTGEWVGFEDDTGSPSDSGGADLNHSFYMRSFKDVCLLIDASSSMDLSGWELSQVHAPQNLVSWMMAHEHPEDFRVGAWRFYDEVEQLVDYDQGLYTAWYELGNAGPHQGNLHEIGQFHTGYIFDYWVRVTDVETPLIEAVNYATTAYDHPEVICIWSDWWHNTGSEDEAVDATYQSVVENSSLFLFANSAAQYGCQCSEEMREAARNSGGGYYEGASAAEVESLYTVIHPIFESRAFQTQVDCAGSDTVTVRADSTMNNLNVTISLASWSGAALQRERENGKEPRRGTFTLKNPTGTSVTPDYSDLSFYQWNIEDPQIGVWQLEVTADPQEEYSVTARGGSNIEFRLLSTGSIVEGSTDSIRVRLEWAELEDEEFELIDQQGDVVAALNLDQESMREFSGEYTFDDPGHFRVRIRGTLGTQTIERLTELCLNVRAAPSFEFVTPAQGEADTSGSVYVIRWTDSCPERNASIILGYDDDDTYNGTEAIIDTIPENDDADSLRWNVFGIPEGTWYLWACIDDSFNAPVRVYGGTLHIPEGYQQGWPKTVGGNVFASPVAVDLHADGSTLEVVVACEDSSVYVWDCYGNLLSGWPVDLVHKSNTTPAIGNIDTSDQELEIVVGAKDGSGTLYCLNHNGTAVSGWPITLGIPINSAATLADLNGDGELEVIVACGDSLHVRESDGTLYSGWPQYTGYTSILFTSPSVADFDGDGNLEIAIAGYPSTLYMFEDDGTLAWDESLIGTFVWAPLSAGDLDWDGLPELLVQDYHSSLSRLYAFNGDGTSPAGWETPIQVGRQARSGASLGDIDGDGRLEVFIGDGNSGYVYGYSSDGNPLPGTWGSGVQIAAQVYAPIGIADIDGDGEDEIIALGNTIDKMYVLETDGTLIDAWCRSLDGDIYAAPCIADIDLDEDPEVLIGTNAGTVYCYDFGGSHDPLRFDYPKFQGDLHNTGLNQDLISPVSPELLSVEKVEPDSLSLKWNTVRTDTYDRDEYVTKYLIYRGDEPYGDDWSTLAGEVEAPDTTFTHQSGTVGDTNTDVYYRVKAEDMHGNRSELSDDAYGEKEFGTNGREKKKTEEREVR